MRTIMSSPARAGKTFTCEMKAVIEADLKPNEPTPCQGKILERSKPFRPDIRCQNCNHLIFDGSVIKSRIVRVLDRGSEVKCSGCKAWVRVPLNYC